MRISNWPELLETWFALTIVNYHRGAKHAPSNRPPGKQLRNSELSTHLNDSSNNIWHNMTRLLCQFVETADLNLIQTQNNTSCVQC